MKYFKATFMYDGNKEEFEIEANGTGAALATASKALKTKHKNDYDESKLTGTKITRVIKDSLD